jgi:hypothetical protein
MQRLLRQLRQREVRLDELRALEIFGHTGEFHTLDYASLVASVEVWEIDVDCEPSLRRNLPEAEVKITDSYAELQRTDRRYDLVVVDNPLGLWGGGHREHFDLFPDLFRVCADPAILVVNVIPNLRPRERRRWDYVFNEEHLAARRDFYGTDQPQDVSLDAMEARYRELCADNGRDVDWVFFVRRHSVYYLTVRLRPSER